MKALHVIDSLGRGGAEQLLAIMLPELSRQGVESLVAVRGGAMDHEPELLAAGLKVVRLPARHRWDVLGSARDIAKLSISEKADIVHAHLYFPTLAAALIKTKRLSPSLTCTTFHNLAYAGANPRTLKLEIRRRLSAWLCRRGIDRFIAVSSAVSHHYRKSLALTKVDVLPNPVSLVDLRKYVLEASPSNAIGSDCKLVLPGRIVREKGHSDLIDALAILRSRGLEPDVTFAGDGPLRPDVERRVIDAGLSAHVHFAGALPHDAMMRQVATADIVVVPSRYEGFGITALEGMALGKPVIATRAGGLPETVGTAGLLVDVHDPIGLANALEELLTKPDLRARLGQTAQLRAEEFDLPSVAAKLISIYREMVAAGRAAGRP